MFGSDRTSSYDTISKCQVEWPVEEGKLSAPRYHGDPQRRGSAVPAPGSSVPQPRPATPPSVDRWVEEQMFEEDLRAVLKMMRPHGHERLLGWSEHRTGGSDFRVTVSWDDQSFAGGLASSPAMGPAESLLEVPRMADVIAALLIGSARSDADVSADDECDAYLAVLGEVARRVEELRGQFA